MADAVTKESAVGGEHSDIQSIHELQAQSPESVSNDMRISEGSEGTSDSASSESVETTATNIFNRPIRKSISALKANKVK